MRATLQILILILTTTALNACDKPASTSTTKPNSPQAKTTRVKSNRPTEKPTLAQIDSRVIEIISDQTGVRTSELTPNINLKKDLKTDDLDLIELVMEIEDVFNLKISDEAAASWHTIGQVIDFVKTNYKP